MNNKVLAQSQQSRNTGMSEAGSKQVRFMGCSDNDD